MNFSANKPYLAQLRKAWYYLFCGFSPALASKLVERPMGAAEKRVVPLSQMEASHPYLSVVGPPPLRFMPRASTPSMDAPRLKSAPAAEHAELPVSKAQPTAPNIPAQTTTPSVKPVPSRPTDAGEPSIIEDDTRPRVHPEEFLPFFQLPSSAHSTSPQDSQPPLPPSSATYRLE